MEPLRHDDPERVRDYRLVARLGAGGMGIVYLGLSPGGRPVAVKVIRPRFAGDDAFRARFRREAAAARTITGAFTAAVLDADPEAAQPYLVTAYLPGVTLREAIATYGPLPPPAVRTLAAGLTEALAGIHHAGLTHRDLKPGNIMLTHTGPRVIDFGIARPDDATAITRTGTVLGTPGFMAPEQVHGTVAGPAADVFALGAVLAFAATGREPFGTGDTRTVLTRVTTAAADLAGITDRVLLALLSECLRVDPTTRPPATALLDRIAHVGFGHVEKAAADAGWLPTPTSAGELIDHPSAARVGPIEEAAGGVGRSPTPTSAGELTDHPSAARVGPIEDAAGGVGRLPTPAPELIDYPSAARLSHAEEAAGGFGWLPGSVAEAIDRRAAAARLLLDPAAGGERPPAPTSVANDATVDPSFSLPVGKTARVSRRAVLLGGATLVAVGVAGVVVLSRDRPPAPTSPPVTRSSAPAVGPVREWQVLVSNSVVEMDVAGGVVIASSWSTGGIRALDPEDGGLVWQRDAEVVADTDGDSAFLINLAGWRVSAVDAATGAEKWAYDPPLGEVSRSAVVAGDVVCFGTDLVRGIGAADGQPRWTADLDANRGFVAAGDVLVCTSLVLTTEMGRIAGVDVNTGQVRWAFDIPQQPADPRAANGMAYVCDAEGTIRAVRAEDGTVVWQQPGLGSSASPWLTADANAMYYSADGEIRAYAASTGAPLWTRPTGRRTGATDVYSIVDKSTIMLAGDTLYVVSNEARLYALDVTDGAVRWEYPETVRAWQIVEMDGLLFVGTFAGRVEAIRPPGGG